MGFEILAFTALVAKSVLGRLRTAHSARGRVRRNRKKDRWRRDGNMIVLWRSWLLILVVLWGKGLQSICGCADMEHAEAVGE